MIVEAYVTLILSVFGTGSDYVPDPVQEEGFIAAAAAEAPVAAPEPLEHTHEHATPASNSSPVEGVWKRLAVCESGMNGKPTWDYDGTRYNWGNGIFDGGLQFTEQTWTAYKDNGDPQYAWQASPERQIAVARKVAAKQGAGAWPHCTSKLGITTEELINE